MSQQHSKYSSWAQFSKEVGGILWAFGKEWSDDFDDDSMLVEETLNILATYINKEKAKAEMAGRIKGRLIQSEAILDKYDAGYDMDVLLKGQIDAWKYEEAQLTKDKEE